MADGTRIRRLTAVAALATALVLGRSSSHAVDNPPVGGPTHGALPMDQQLARIDELLPQRDVRQPPAGIDPTIFALFIPADNEMTPERVALGKKLYFETRLSADGTVACATCHDVVRNTDRDRSRKGSAISSGAARHDEHLRLPSLFLDGRALRSKPGEAADHQPVEMGQPDGNAVTHAIANDPDYQRMFQTAYGRLPNYDDIGRAIAAFERTLVFLDSPFDKFLAGETDAISPQAQQGWVLYNGKARCVSCHPFNRSNPLGSDRFHNVGVSARHQDFEEARRPGARRAAETRRHRCHRPPRLEHHLRGRRSWCRTAATWRLPHAATAQHRHHRALHA
jgi:cytochrome c peroxidase